MFLSPSLAEGEMEGGGGISCLEIRGRWGDSILKDGKAIDEVRVPGRRRVEHLKTRALLSVL